MATLHEGKRVNVIDNFLPEGGKPGTPFRRVTLKKLLRICGCLLLNKSIFFTPLLETSKLSTRIAHSAPNASLKREHKTNKRIKTQCMAKRTNASLYWCAELVETTQIRFMQHLLELLRSYGISNRMVHKCYVWMGGGGGGGGWSSIAVSPKLL